MGRLIVVAAALIPAGVVVAAVLIGLDWWADASTAAEVLATEVVASDHGVSSAVMSNDPDPSGIHVVQSVVPGAGDGAVIAGSLPRLPSPTTSSPAVQPGPSTTGETSASSTSDPSTAPNAPTTPLPTTTSIPSTMPTVGATTTSQAPSTTTTHQVSTTSLDTTTTIPPTTTTQVATTATCAGNSGGNGNAPCGP